MIICICFAAVLDICLINCNMSIFNSPLSDNYLSRLIFDEIELKNNVNQYINRMKISEWSNNFNRIFISPGNSFNTKYFIKVPI